MGNYSQQIDYVPPSTGELTSDDFVLLEQEKWDPNVNYLTKMGVLGYLMQLLYQGVTQEESCSTDMTYYCYAYPSRPELDYRIGATHGELSPAVIELFEYTEAIQCSLVLTLTPKYPVIEIKRFDWIGDCYSKDGDVIVKPVLSGNGEDITVDSLCYGTVLVTYTVCRHTYELTIESLEGATENALQAWIWAAWDYGTIKMECEFPDGADTGTCLNSATGDTGSISDVGPDRCVQPEDDYATTDYCNPSIKP